LQPPYLIIVCATLLTLVYASYRDLKLRDIPELTWVPATLLAIVLNVTYGEYIDMLFLLFSLMPAILLLIMSLLGMIGGADFLAILLIGLAHPKFILMPVSLLTLIYSLIIPLLLIIYYAIYNLVKFRDVLKKIKCVTGRKVYLVLFGKPVKISDFMSMKFTYLLTIPSNDGFTCRASFSLEEEEEEAKELIAKYVNKNMLSLNDYVWVTPALPHVLFILVGYVLALLTPEQLIIHFIFG